MMIVRKVFRVEGMYCGACAVSADIMLMAVEGVKFARVDFETCSAEVEYNQAHAGLIDLNHALKGLGYRLEERT